MRVCDGTLSRILDRHSNKLFFMVSLRYYFVNVEPNDSPRAADMLDMVQVVGLWRALAYIISPRLRALDPNEHFSLL